MENFENNYEKEGNINDNESNIVENNTDDVKCPECGAKCVPNQNFCNECGFDLHTKKCPQCSNTFPLEQKFCTGCGYKFVTDESPKLDDEDCLNESEKTSKNILKYSIILCIVLLVLMIVFWIVLNYKSFEKDTTKSENCESQVVNDLVLDIFKEHNNYYKFIDSKSINEIKLEFPEQTGYDSEMDKYFCSGTIVMRSKNTGFLPLSTELSNKYYSKIAHDYFYDPDEWYWERYTEYKIPVKFTSQLSGNSTLVNLKQDTRKEEFNVSSGSDIMPSKKVKPLKYAPPSSSSSSYSDVSTSRNDYDTYDAPSNYDLKRQVENETNY